MNYFRLLFFSVHSKLDDLEIADYPLWDCDFADKEFFPKAHVSFSAMLQFLRKRSEQTKAAEVDAAKVRSGCGGKKWLNETDPKSQSADRIAREKGSGKSNDLVRELLESNHDLPGGSSSRPLA